MSESPFSLPLFPLSAHILPGGRMALRIFEPRYVRMVKEACAGQTGFVICMLNSLGDKSQNKHIYPVGTYVTVEDFDLLDDGLLGITVQGHRCVKILSVESADDHLRVGQCEWLENWVGEGIKDDVKPMEQRLRELFDKYPEVKNLYDTPEFDNPIWVIYRWLELIPVNAEQKQQFLQHKDYSIALNYLAQLVE